MENNFYVKFDFFFFAELYVFNRLTCVLYFFSAHPSHVNSRNSKVMHQSVFASICTHPSKIVHHEYQKVKLGLSFDFHQHRKHEQNIDFETFITLNTLQNLIFLYKLNVVFEAYMLPLNSNGSKNTKMSLRRKLCAMFWVRAPFRREMHENILHVERDSRLSVTNSSFSQKK